MSDLSASSCGCATPYSNCCGGNNGIWILILFFLFCNGGCNNLGNIFSNGCGCGCDDNNSWIWIILFIFLIGNNGCGCGCGCNN